MSLAPVNIRIVPIIIVPPGLREPEPCDHEPPCEDDFMCSLIRGMTEPIDDGDGSTVVP